jgi:signal transduction histidine kinase
MRLQFVFLVAGVILMPVFVMGVSFFVFDTTMYPSNPQDYFDDFHNKLGNVESVDQLEYLFDDLEASYFGMVVTPSGTSFSKRFPDGGESANPLYILDSRLQRLSDGTPVQVILGVNVFDESGIIFPVLFLFSIMAALTILSLIIIRSINKSITTLETATKRIAAGDLDFKIQMKRADKIGSLAVSLDTMRQQIKAEGDRRQRFYMGVSHDLMTPLSSISGYSEALLSGLSKNEDMTMKYLGIINRKSYELEQRISHLLNYIGASNLEFQKSLKNQTIALFLRDFLESQSEEQGFYGRLLEWSVKIPEDLQIPFNEELLGRALENLIQNGFKYGTAASPVAIESSHHGDHLEITVRNLGPAIPPEIQPMLFEPFFRGDNSRRGEGFGLGLSSVKSIIESHGWNITLYSDNEKTFFSIVVPLM